MTAQLALLPFANPGALRPQRVALVTQEATAQAEERFRIIEPCLDFKANAHIYARLRLADGSPVTSFTRMVEYTAETTGLSRGTLFNWIKACQRGGKPALADRQRRDKGTSRFFSKYPKAAWYAAYLHLGDRELGPNMFSPQSARDIYRAILRDLERLEIPRGDEPSYETVRAWLDKTPAALEIYAHKGQKAYRDLVAPYWSMAYVDTWANQWWVCDHAIHDLLARNDSFADAEWGALIRMRITTFLDYRSRALISSSWCWEGSSRSLGAALGRGILRWGAPEGIKLDNGKDMKKFAKGALPGWSGSSPLVADDWWRRDAQSIESSGAIAMIGARVLFSLPHHPQGKNVERFYRTMHMHFCRVWPTYTSGSPFTRPDGTTVAMMEHGKLQRAGRADESCIPLTSQVIAMGLGWIEEYNDTPHTGEGMEGATPNQVWKQTLNPRQKPTPPPEALALLKTDRVQCLVRECAVTLDKRRYMPADAAGWTAMHHLSASGTKVLVAFDRAAPESVDVLDQDGHFVARLEAEAKMRFAPGEPEVQLQIASHRQTALGLERATRETSAIIGRVARAEGALTPLQSMAARLRLAPGETGADAVTQRRRERSADPEPENTLLPGQAADRLAARLMRRNGQ